MVLKVENVQCLLVKSLDLIICTISNQKGISIIFKKKLSKIKSDFDETKHKLS